MVKINWGSGCKVHMLEAASPIARGGPITGVITLRTAIGMVMAMPTGERKRASIVVGHDSGTEKKILRYKEIESLYRQSDFPDK